MCECFAYSISHTPCDSLNLPRVKIARWCEQNVVPRGTIFSPCSGIQADALIIQPNLVHELSDIGLPRKWSFRSFVDDEFNLCTLSAPARSLWALAAVLLPKTDLRLVYCPHTDGHQGIHEGACEEVFLLYKRWK